METKPKDQPKIDKPKIDKAVIDSRIAERDKLLADKKIIKK